MLTGPDSQKRPLVLDTRGGYKEYISGHIPGARHINFDTLRGTDENGVPVQYLPNDMTKTLLERAGVNKNRKTLLYAEGGTGDEILSASMVAYVLEKYGVTDIQIIDGGLPKYLENFPLSQDYPKIPKGSVNTKTNPAVGMDVKTVLAKKDKPNVVLVDARPENEYLGNDKVWPRKGHIPGAINFPWRQVMETANTHQFRSPEVMAAMFKSAGITPEKEVIVYCGTSREGSLLRFYLKHIAKYPNVNLYEGSWKEYAALKELPAETIVSKVR